jgi:hypothetical protein
VLAWFELMNAEYGQQEVQTEQHPSCSPSTAKAASKPSFE